MPSTISGNLPSYSDHPTSIPPSRTSRPLCKNQADGLKLPTPLTYSERVVQHISRYGLHPFSIADSPLPESLSWAQSKEPKPVTRLPFREARARPGTCLETETVSAGTATHSERRPAPLGSGTPLGAQFQGPQVSTSSPIHNPRDSRPSGTLGGNTHMGIDCCNQESRITW